MTQNVISLALSADQLAEVNKALDMLEKNLTELISLSVDDRSELRKMGPKSEMFARKAYDVLAQSPEILPGTFELADFTVDLEALDQLRPVFARIAALAGRADDTEMALGSDIFNAALEGYRYAKLAGKGAALDELKAQASVRFSGQRKRKGGEGSKPA